MNKTCKECGQEKSVSEFYKDSKMQDGYRSNCKECHRGVERLRWQGNYTEAPKLPPKPRPGRDPEKKRLANRKSHLRINYGITIEEYDGMLLVQNGRCAICCEEKSLVVDHCHANGHVRGLLCGECNKGLGLFRDNPEFLESAIVYLGQKAP